MSTLAQTPPDEELLKNSWHRLCQQLDLSSDQSVITQTYLKLLASYAEPHRVYHGIQHLVECISLFEQVSHWARQPALLEVALWFHDTIYQTQPYTADNEQRSATWAEVYLQQCNVDPRIIQQVRDLVMATRHHQAKTVDEQLMVDIDLAILGSTPQRFEQYQQQIRQEYNFVPAALFNEKRKQVLYGFYQRERIYQTGYFYHHYEQQARQNLQNALIEDDAELVS